MLHSLVVIDRTRDVGLVVYTYNEMTKNISGQFVEHWSEKEQWRLSNLILSAKLPVGIIEVCDRSKVISGKPKMHLWPFPELATLKVEKTVAQILPHALSPPVVSRAGTKEVTKRIHNCYRKLA